MITGNLEDFNEELARGWLLDTNQPEKEFTLNVFLNDIKVKSVITKKIRDDVAVYYGHTGHGFKFAIKDFINQPIANIRIEVDCDVFSLPNNEKMFYHGRNTKEIQSEIQSNRDIFLFPSELYNKIQFENMQYITESGQNELLNLFSKTKFIFIIFTNRSGSNLVTDMLEAMGFGSGTTNEPFLADTILKVMKENSLGSIDQYVSATITYWSRNDVFFAKMGWDALFLLTKLGIFKNIYKNSAFIFVKRKDKILQAISYLKAIRSGEFFTLQNNENNNFMLEKPQFWENKNTASAITKIIHDLHVSENRLEYFMTLKNLPYKEVFYEDMLEDINREYNKIRLYLFNKLNIETELVEFQPRLVKQATGDEFNIKSIFLKIMEDE